MMRSTIVKLFAHNDWARDKLLTLAQGLTDEQLDRPFEMGPGSLRATLRHLYGAERIWLERWHGRQLRQFPPSRTIDSVTDLWQAWRQLAKARNDYLGTLAEKNLAQPVTYANPEGQTCTRRLGDLMLHVCNHGTHHRAQVLNMLRHLDVKVTGQDYLFMRAERPTVAWEPATWDQLREMGFPVPQGQPKPAEPARLDVETLRTYFHYGDWAVGRVHAVAEALSDEQLDRPFEMGIGTLRKTLLHIRDAEQWWHDNWTHGAQPEFNKLPQTTSISELWALAREAAERRNGYLDTITDEDLQRIIGAYVRPDVLLRFRLGESMLQLCGHGTHHRAQALNMLRHLGADVPPLEYVAWLCQDPRQLGPNVSRQGAV